jgi:triosephosphate isomerase
MRIPVVAGNWKMYKTVDQAVQLTEEILSLLDGITGVEVAICPPFTALEAVARVLKETSIGLGAQNMYHEREGAFTGEISAEMLLTIGCQYVILGHSERRTYFGETDESVNKKVIAALRTGLTPIVCVGETLDERQAGTTEQVIERQIRGAFQDVTEVDLQRLIIAYEPVWAIGTGLTATPGQAQDVHRFIRRLLGDHVAEEIRIQYGGSVKPENACDLFTQPDVDGGLIGGASLKAESFVAIVRSAVR